MRRSVICHPPRGKRCSFKIDIPLRGSVPGAMVIHLSCSCGKVPPPLNRSWVGDQFIQYFLLHYSKPLWTNQAENEYHVCVRACKYHRHPFSLTVSHNQQVSRMPQIISCMFPNSYKTVITQVRLSEAPVGFFSRLVPPLFTGVLRNKK